MGGWVSQIPDRSTREREIDTALSHRGGVAFCHRMVTSCVCTGKNNNNNNSERQRSTSILVLWYRLSRESNLLI